MRTGQIRARTLIIRGAEDEPIPPTHAQELYVQSAASDKRPVLIPEAGHNDLMAIGAAGYFDAIRRFVRQS